MTVVFVEHVVVSESCSALAQLGPTQFEQGGARQLLHPRPMQSQMPIQPGLGRHFDLQRVPHFCSGLQVGRGVPEDTTITGGNCVGGGSGLIVTGGHGAGLYV